MGFDAECGCIYIARWNLDEFIHHIYLCMAVDLSVFLIIPGCTILVGNGLGIGPICCELRIRQCQSKADLLDFLCAWQYLEAIRPHQNAK